MDISEAVKDVNVTELAAKVGISRRTMFRWVAEGIPGREPEQKLWASRIEKAADKLRANAIPLHPDVIHEAVRGKGRAA